MDRRRDEDFSAEIRSHIELETERLISDGMAPEEARAAAVRQFGNVTAAEERFYESRRILWMDQLLQDLRYAWRGLRQSPAFAIVAVLTLALGIGATTAIFSIVKAVLLEPMPYYQPDRLVHLIQNLPATMTIDARPRRIVAMDLEEFLHLQKQTTTLQLAAYDDRREVTLAGTAGGNEPVRIVGTPVSAAMLQVLGVQPLRGRFFTSDEERPDPEQPVILSYAAWRRYFAASEGLLNQTVQLDGRLYRVIGIMPASFEFPDPVSDFWIPLDMAHPAQGEIRSVVPLGRLKDGSEVSAAASEASAIMEQLRGTYPAERVLLPSQIEVVAVKDELVRPVRPALLVLMIAVAFVLLIACSNVVSLLLARGTARRSERALRAALGAGRGRLIRQALTESCLLGLLGGIAGIVLSYGGVQLLRNLASDYVPRLRGSGIDIPVLVFALAVSILTSLLFGLIPAVQFSRGSHAELIKTGGSGKASARQRTRSLIIVAETAMAVVLLIGGGLLIRSFLKLSGVDVGFDPRNVLAFQVALSQPVNRNMLAETMTEEFQTRLKALPGVTAVAFSNALPLIPRNGFSQPRIEGTPIPIAGIPEYREVSREYFAAMGIRLLDGRSFNDADGPGRPRVAVINKTMAGYFGNENPIGKTIRVSTDNEVEIVGIVNDIHDQALNVDPRPQVYLHVRQAFASFRNAQALNWAYFVVRGERAAESMIPAVRGIVGQMIPGATLRLNVAGMESVVWKSIGRPRLYAVLLGIFGIVAVVLAMIGIYGVTNYSVAQRTREMGIRIALGATPREMLSLALRHSLMLAILGIGAGFSAAALLTKYLEGMLFGLTTMDTMTFLLAPASFALTAVVAAWIPARRATRVDPLISLRHE